MGGITKSNRNELEYQITNLYSQFNRDSPEKQVENVELLESNEKQFNPSRGNRLACHPTEMSFSLVEDYGEIDDEPVKDEPVNKDSGEFEPKSYEIEDSEGKTFQKHAKTDYMKSEGTYRMEYGKLPRTKDVSTSSQDLNRLPENCGVCGCFIGYKLEECQIQLEILKIEKKRLLAFSKQLNRDKKEMDYKQQQIEKETRELQLELEKERKKLLTKEMSEKPKRVQRKKEIQEMMKIKIELDEIKKQMNERVSRNATCIANLRNHIKTIDKEKYKLQEENEKLLNDKIKLTADLNNKKSDENILKQTRRKELRRTVENQHQCPETFLTSDLVTSENIETPENHQKIVTDGSIEEKYNNMFRNSNFNDDIDTSTTKERQKSFSLLSETETLLENGCREIRYPNGNKKIISEDCIIRNYYANNDIWHINFPDGTEVIEFPNGQCEKRYKDGKCLVFFPDGLIQILFPNGTEQLKYPNGTKILTNKEGDRMSFLPSGLVEIHTKNHKTREYPDGTVKIFYADGSQEQKYPNGRIKIKNSKGEVILDTGER